MTQVTKTSNQKTQSVKQPMNSKNIIKLKGLPKKNNAIELSIRNNAKVTQNKKVKSQVIDLKKRKQKMIEEYLVSKKELSIKERNLIVEQYLPMIKSIARRISSRLPPNIQQNDLISNAVIGLMDAIKKYDPERNNKFKTYAEFRVRGAVLDALRAQDWTPRSIRDKAKRIDRATKKLEQELSRLPVEKEVAAALDISLDEYYIMLNQTREVSLFSIDESYMFTHNDKDFVLKMLEDSDSSVKQINKKFLQTMLIEAIKELPERQRIVLSLYYYEEFNLKKIGQILKVTESRVSQLHAQAIDRLKYKLKDKIEKQELNAA